MMKALGEVVYGLHCLIGITAPPPEKRPLFFFVWLGIFVFFLAFTALLVYLVIHFSS